MANKQSKIPIPLHYRWQRIRYRMMPVIVFVVCGIMSFQLWRTNALTANAVGVVSAQDVPAVSLAEGTLMPMSGKTFKLYDEVKAGEVIAVLNSKQIELELDVIQKQILALQEELKAESYLIEIELQDKYRDQATMVRRLTEQVESIRLEILDREADLAANEIELERQDQKLLTLSTIFPGEAGENNLEVINTKLRRDIVKKQVENIKKALAEARLQLAAANDRLAALPEVIKADVNRVLAPIRGEIDVAKAELAEVQFRQSNLMVKAPISGKITDIHKFPGETIQAGDGIMTISSNTDPFIIAYIRNSQRIFPKTGMEVHVKTRLQPHDAMIGKVEEVGVQFQIIPEQLVTRTDIIEWGLPVRISYPEGLQARPNEMVRLYFDMDSVPSASGTQ